MKKFTSINSPTIGSGYIAIRTLKDGDRFITTSEYTFKDLNTEGTIKELEKIINTLKQDLKTEEVTNLT